MKATWKKQAGSLWTNWIKPFAVVILIMSTFRSAVADWNDVPTGSMRPTILEGDRIFVNKLAYDLKLPFTQFRLATWGEPQRGEVVVLFSPADGTRLVKRVVGVPGDLLELRNNHLFVNGAAAEYGPLEADTIAQIEQTARRRHRFVHETVDGQSHPVMLTPGVASPKTFAPLVVPASHFFMMGDNRDQSGDSRSFGFVSRDAIVGRSSRVVMSLDRGNYFLPRPSRFFRPLP